MVIHLGGIQQLYPLSLTLEKVTAYFTPFNRWFVDISHFYLNVGAEILREAISNREQIMREKFVTAFRERKKNK